MQINREQLNMAPEVSTIRGPMVPFDAATLADRDAICQICRIYALAIDTRDEAMLRSLFWPKAVIRGWLGESIADEHLPQLLAGVKRFQATMHSILNQYVVVQGDAANVLSYGVAYHIEAPGNGRKDVVMGVHYRDRVERTSNGWWIVGREVVHQWAHGPLPSRN